MTTLYKRAGPRQAQLLRMVEGAVKNAMHAHPGRVLDNHIARSIAKRAAGTVSAQWPVLLAVPQGQSDSSAKHPLNSHGTRDGHWKHHSEKGRVLRKEGAALVRAHHLIGNLADIARRDGDQAGLDAYVSALRIIGKEIAKIEATRASEAAA